MLRLEILDRSNLLALEQALAGQLGVVIEVIAEPASLHVRKRCFGHLDGTVRVHRCMWQLNGNNLGSCFLQYEQCGMPGSAYFGVKWVNKGRLWHTKLQSLQ